uniref:hypothetical protein n=1 Tax=Scandinavium goeteborgense TaxID=1851514 RepID=UPI00135C7283|nr:hypothetical protein [Scandinavium goeteborgense]
MIDQTITLESFADLLVDEGLTSAFLEIILSILAEIKPHAAAVPPQSWHYRRKNSSFVPRC